MSAAMSTPDLTPELTAVADEYERFLHLCRHAEPTVKVRVNLARSRLAEWGLTGFTSDGIFEWLGRPGLSDWTRATYYANLKDLCSFLVAAGHLDASPMEDGLLHKPKRPRSLPRPLTAEQLGRVLAAAEGRVRDWVVLALLAGLRVHEIAKLRGEDVSPDGIFVKGKGGVEAVLPCHSDLWAMAQRYPRRGWWFPSPAGGHLEPDTITAHVSLLFRQLGIAGSIHRLRHTYATGLLRSGVNVRVVQQLMRHGSLETTALYTAVDEEEKRAAIDLLPTTAVEFSAVSP